MAKVSVIVPVYKAEKYIEKCAISLLSQTLDDIEYIFIDDCTPDDSIKVLKKVVSRYPERAAQVRIERMSKNSGPATVRGYGIKLATGDYVIHCDSDDWVDTDLYEILYKKAVETSVDIVAFPVTENWDDRSSVIPLPELGSDCQNLLENWYKNSVQMYTVNKLVKRSIFIDHHILPFEGMKMWEDNGLMLRVFYYAKGIAQIEGSTYHYYRGNESATTNGYGRDAVDQMIKCARCLDEFFKDKPDYERYKKTAEAVKLFARLNLVTTSFSDLREYYRTFPETDYMIPLVGRSAFSSKGIIRFRFVKYHLAWLFVFLFKIASWVRR